MARGGDFPAVCDTLTITRQTVTTTAAPITAGGTIIRFHSILANTAAIKYRQGTSGDYAEISPGDVRYIHVADINTIYVVVDSGTQVLCIERYQ